MQIDTLPVHAPVPDPASGEEREVAAALLLMNEAADDGRTTGWYWAVVPRNPEPEDMKSRRRWTEAVTNHQGPFRDANTAIAAAENHTPQTTALATRLGQAAELLRAGEIDTTVEAISEWLLDAGAPDRGADTEPPAPVGPDPDAGAQDGDPEDTAAALRGEIPDEGDTDPKHIPDEQLDTHDQTADADSGADEAD